VSEGEQSRPPLRILLGSDTFDPDVNGSATFTRNLARGLIGRGHDVHVMAPATRRRRSTSIEVLDGTPMTVHRIYSWRWLPHPWLRFMLPWRVKANAERVVKAVEPDVIHFQSHIVVGRGLATSARKRGIRLIGTNHTMPDNMLQHVAVLPHFMLNWLARIQWKSARHWFTMADVVTAPTQRAADFFEKHTGITGVLAISCGIDAHLYTADFTPRNRNVVSFLGRIDEEKYIHELLEAVALLPDLDIQVRIIGDGEVQGHLKARAAELGIADRVDFLGRVSEEDKYAALTSTTVFAMPSRAELQSIATMEALASGVPVVAADAMALPHLVHPGENGYLYEPGDIAQFAAHLRTVLTAPPAEFERLKRGALETVEAHDIERTLDIFEAVYRGEPIPEGRAPRQPTRRDSVN
jgi:glycosyltransferase involved in cell wall biosynthesis